MVAERTIYASLPSASRAAATYNSDVHLETAKGIRATLDVTDVGAGGTVDMKVQVKDPTSGNYVDVPNASIVQIIAATTRDLVVAPGAVAVANRVVGTVLGEYVRVVVTIGANAVTFSLTIETF